MINQPRENGPLSSRPTQRAASVMVKANKWLPACVAEDGVQLDIIRQLILHGFIHMVSSS